MDKDKLLELRQFYKSYEDLLIEKLKEVGIEAKTNTTNQLTELGKPVVPTGTAYIYNLVPLRENEYALFVINAGSDGVYAFPDNGIGLRYLKFGSNMERMETIGKFNNKYLLAAVSDGKNIYALTDEGVVIHNNAELDEKIKVFNKLEYCMSIWQENIEQSAVEQYINNNFNSVFVDLDGAPSPIYYNTEKKVFVWDIVSGGYHDPVDHTYIQLSKKEVMRRMVDYPGFSVRRYIEDCKKGVIPMVAVVSLLEEDESIINYKPDYET